MNPRALLFAVVVAASAAWAAPSHAQVSPQGKSFGIGLQLGAPTAVTGKYMLTPEQALVGGIGAGLGWDVSLSLHLDYLWHPTVLATIPPATFSWYVGGGAWLAFFAPGAPGFYYAPYYYFPQSPVGVGARLPIGVDMAFRHVPFELYLEGVPTLAIFPRISFGLGVAIGARFWF